MKTAMSSAPRALAELAAMGADADFIKQRFNLPATSHGDGCSNVLRSRLWLPRMCSRNTRRHGRLEDPQAALSQLGGGARNALIRS